MRDLTIGYTNTSSGVPKPAILKPADRRRNTWILGRSGSGKSTLVRNLAVQAIWNNERLCVLDVNGSVVPDLLSRIPRHRTSDVAILDPTDTHCLGLNLLEAASPEEKELVAASAVNVFRTLYSSSWGPRSEWVLRNVVLAVLDRPAPTLVDVYKMLVDRRYRQKTGAKAQDPVVRLFWAEFAKYNDRFASEVMSPLINKVGSVMTNRLRPILGQPRSTIDLKKAIKGRTILLASLNANLIGTAEVRLLGSILLLKLFLAARSNAVPGKVPWDFSLFIDEAQSFTIDPGMLSAGRAFGLNFALAHQYSAQLPEELKEAVMANFGTWLMFKLSVEDSLLMEKEFAPQIKMEDFRRQRNYQIFFKVMRDGLAGLAQWCNTTPAMDVAGAKALPDRILRSSRERYAKPRDLVEKAITAALTTH
jgi:hypothetical protein